MKKKNITILIVLLLCFVQITGFAMAVSNAPDLSKPLSLTVEMKHNSTSLSNVNITIYHVAAVNTSGYSWTFDKTSGFAGSQADVNNITSAEVNLALGTELRDYAVANSIDGVSARTNASGKAQFVIADAGLYLIVPGDVRGYYNVEPYLVSVPGTVSGGDEWVYDVIAQPKTELRPTPTPTPTPSPAPPLTPSPSPETSSEPETTPEPEISPDPSPVSEESPEPSELPEPSPSPAPPNMFTPPVTPAPTPVLRSVPIIPPLPSSPGHTIVIEDDIIFELDEEGVPLGEWRWDDEDGWILDEYPPLAQLPQTGMLRWPVQAMAGSGVVMFASGWVVLKKSKDND